MSKGGGYEFGLGPRVAIHSWPSDPIVYKGHFKAFFTKGYELHLHYWWVTLQTFGRVLVQRNYEIEVWKWLACIKPIIVSEELRDFHQ